MQYRADLINLEVFSFLQKVACIPKEQNTFKMALPLPKSIFGLTTVYLVIFRNYYVVFCLCYIFNKMTTAPSSLHYNELIPFQALSLMFSLHSFRLSTPPTSIFPIPILLQHCSRIWKSFRNGHA